MPVRAGHSIRPMLSPEAHPPLDARPSSESLLPQQLATFSTISRSSPFQRSNNPRPCNAGLRNGREGCGFLLVPEPPPRLPLPDPPHRLPLLKLGLLRLGLPLLPVVDREAGDADQFAVVGG